MAVEDVGILTPSEKRTIQACAAKCASCRQMQDYLDALGQPDKDLRDRVDHLQMLAEKAMELDRASRRS